MYSRILLLFFTLFSLLFAAGEKRPVNALIHEESPYLQQHAHNPVHWMPWGDAAFEKAKREHKLIFLSIGYSTCHWCHVMERESFENPEVAKLLNRFFVAIKVDREERPQIDRYYQRVYRLINRRAGGWPLTILLTPDRRPFFAATYLPREERYRQPGLLDLLRTAAETWRKRPEKIEKIAAGIDRAVQRTGRTDTTRPAPVTSGLSTHFVRTLRDSFDAAYGGWGLQPKFPRAMTLTTLLKIYELTGDRTALKMATRTLEAMARGGIYDQVEGGFYRYSTDREWTIPHFEKMLYTNAELLEAYALAAQISGEPLFRKVVRETVAVMRRHYRDPDGLFYGASDADSLDPERDRTEEGFYYTYRYDRLLPRLGKAGIAHPARALKEFGITENGNFIRFRSNPRLDTRGWGDPRVRRLLRALRERRPYPFIDKKLQTSWNALWIHALFGASSVDRRYRDLALETLERLDRQLDINGTLYHQKLPGRPPRVPALLEDYSFLIAATLDAYDATQDRRWLNRAESLIARAKRHFEKQGIWYDSAGTFRNPLTLEGGSYRSPLAVLADDYLRLAVYTENLDYREAAQSILRSGAGILDTYPAAAPMAVSVWLAQRFGYVILKLPAEKFRTLRRKISSQLRYPFLLYRETNDDLLQACRVDRCFLYDRNASAFLHHLRQSLKKADSAEMKSPARF